MVKSSSFQQPGKKLMNSLMDTHTKIVRPVKSFVLKSSSEFASRSLGIFNKLNAIEVNHTTWISKNETLDSFDLNNNEPAPVTTEIFKKPFAPVSRKRKGSIFPHRKNMKKWIKYSLEDVQISSDATNTAVALQFLDELRKKREKNVDEEKSDDNKIAFRKPVKRSLNASKSVVSSTSVSDNVISGHHSVSKSVPAKKMKTSDTNIKLLHLEDDVDDAF